MSKKYFKSLNFGSNGTYAKFTVLVHFGVQFTAGKPKILLKTKISAKTASLGIINNISPRSEKNHKILVKLSLKTFFGSKLGLNCTHGAMRKGNHRFSQKPFGHILGLFGKKTPVNNVRLSWNFGHRYYL